jgi:uncharacterized membrane protein
VRLGWHLGIARLGILLLSGAGIAVSAYLLIVRATSGAACFGLGDCAAVNASPYSELAGVPVSLLGLITYILLFALTLVWLRTSPDSFSLLALAVFGLSAAGLGFSAWLTYVELFIILAICPWCVSSAGIITTIFGLSLSELLRRRVPAATVRTERPAPNGHSTSSPALTR